MKRLSNGGSNNYLANNKRKNKIERGRVRVRVRTRARARVSALCRGNKIVEPQIGSVIAFRREVSFLNIDIASLLSLN